MDTIEKIFRNNRLLLEKTTGHLSVIKHRMQSEYHKNIMALGKKVIPYIIKDLELNGSNPLWAGTLPLLLPHVNPIPIEDRNKDITGKTDIICKYWIKWWHENKEEDNKDEII